MSDSKKPVRFEVILKDDSKSQEVKSKLENMADDIKINLREFKNPDMTFVFGETSQMTYESKFDAKLVYNTRNVLSAGRYRNVSNWQETKKAKVPDYLEDLVTEINLSVKKRAC